MRKKLIITLLFLALILLLIWGFWKINNVKKISQNQTANISSNSNSKTGSALIVNKTLTATSTSTSTSAQDEGKSTTEKIASTDLINKEFAAKMPEINSRQLGLFSDIAISGKMDGCEKSSETSDKCKYYFSVYQNKDGFCGDIEDSTLRLSCYKELIFNGFSERFLKCNNENSLDVRINCLNNLFWATRTVDSCALFEESAAYQICVDLVNLSSINLENKDICLKIKDASFKNFCEQSFVLGDFDKDGLTDTEELKLGTNPYSADTDSDGHNDKEEIEKGYNPCGDGVMPSSDNLIGLCAKFKK